MIYDFFTDIRTKGLWSMSLNKECLISVNKINDVYEFAYSKQGSIKKKKVFDNEDSAYYYVCGFYDSVMYL